MNQNQNLNTEVTEFYEHRTNVNPVDCEHHFKRLSATRVICDRCGIGFFDTPFDPFPVDEINKKTRSDRKENNKLKKELLEKQNII